MESVKVTNTRKWGMEHFRYADAEGEVQRVSLAPGQTASIDDRFVAPGNARKGQPRSFAESDKRYERQGIVIDRSPAKVADKVLDKRIDEKPQPDRKVDRRG